MKRGVLLVLLAIIGLSIGIHHGHTSALSVRTQRVCTQPLKGDASCDAIVLTDGGGVQPLVSSKPQGYGPATFQSAYQARGGHSTSIGVVVAYDAPNIQADLTTFSKAFGLPALPSCTSATEPACFEKLSQHGTATYPTANSSWAVEASLDVESIHGMCPGCRINLIEASSPSMTNLASAVDEAVASGAKVISNSYGGAESSGEAAYDSHYHKSGVTMVVSSGDDGYGANYPAASPYVVAVGGTTLQVSGSRVVSETAWNGAGSGCSQFEAKPTWQTDKKCSRRSVADVAADADPETGAAIYDSYTDEGRQGWLTVGGTSLAAPLVAGMLAASSHSNNEPAFLYGDTTSFIRDVIAGDNGSCATYLCKASSGYDGPTGLGVLRGL